MEKMRMETKDMTEQNIEKIGAMFPNCITETRDENGKLRKAINFDMLRQMLSADVVEGDEAYEFTWVGKKAAIVEANRPIRKTLRPCPEESVDWDTTENLYIEGDNLEVLKLLQESYLGKIKMIYIDPPYNTGNDFIYRDEFSVSADEYAERMGEYSDTGDRLFKNTDANGRFHSAWCSMMYERLLIARSLLADDGVIMISIDENEFKSLGLICDQVFGERNFVECLVYDKKAAAKGVPPVNMVVGVHEYIYCYAKKYSQFSFVGSKRSTESFSNPDNDPRGLWRNTNIKSTTSEKRFTIYDPMTGIGYTDTWAFSEKEIERLIQEKRLLFPQNGKGQVRIKEFYNEFTNANTPIKSSLGLYDAQWNTEMLTSLMGGKFFQSPKHLKLMQDLISYTTKPGDIVLDFFSGSASTAHAVFCANDTDQGNRSFIMVQLNEPCDPKGDAFKAGYKSICDIGKERIRRAGKKIKSESPLTTQNLDTGFRVFKLDSSNMTDVYYSAGEYTQSLLTTLESNVKEDRTDLDLLFGCLLEWGLPLSMPYKSEKLEGCTVHTYNDGDLIACFDENIPDGVIKEIARRKPLRAVFRDSSFDGSPAKINVGEIFKMLAPDTRIKVI